MPATIGLRAANATSFSIESSTTPITRDAMQALTRFIASQGHLDQTFVTDVSWRTVVGEGSGEAFSLRFDGKGIVFIQPEER